MHINDIYALAHTDLKKTEQLITENLHSPIGLINDLSDHIIQSGGKRIRPLLVLLSAKSLGYEGDLHIHLAAVVELIHTATLLHDDVIDSSTLRRGQGTANAVWGNQASVLVGDYLYSHAFRLMVGMNQMLVMDMLAESTNTIVQGEILQLMHCHNPDITEETYLDVIQRKTGKLFQTSTKLGSILAPQADQSALYQSALGEFGMHLGTAFQIIDDALDYQAHSEQMGKNRGDDLTEGKTTLPLIYALQHCNAEDAQIIRQSLLNGDSSQLDKVISIIEATKAMEYTFEFAKKIILQAIDCLNPLPDSEYRNALKGLAQFVVQREH
jgi:octaprenyl-diphosphate synthase